MSQLQSDTMTTTSTQTRRRRWRSMPIRDRRDRMAMAVGGVGGAFASSFVIATASWWDWPTWAQVLACVPVLGVSVILCGMWYHRRSPVAANNESA